MGVDNILELYRVSDPAEREDGTNWYPNVRTWCRAEGRNLSKPIEHMVGVVAALSPRLNWRDNLTEATKVVKAHGVGLAPADLKSKALGANVAKAYRILDGNALETVLGGFKVCSFADNLLHPDSQAVTVDAWAERIWLGNLNHKAVGLDAKRYTLIADAYREAAEELQVQPCTIQAITWIAARRRATANTSLTQLPLWS